VVVIRNSEPKVLVGREAMRYLESVVGKAWRSG